MLDISRQIHDLVFKDASQSLCARAWTYRRVSLFWRAWVAVFGQSHCKKSWDYYWGENNA